MEKLLVILCFSFLLQSQQLAQHAGIIVKNCGLTYLESFYKSAPKFPTSKKADYKASDSYLPYAQRKIEQYQMSATVKGSENGCTAHYFKLIRNNTLFNISSKSRNFGANQLGLAYSDTEAGNIERKKIEALSDQSKTFIAVISIMALTIISFIIILMKSKDELAKKRIDSLNQAANLQIIEMEEIKKIAIGEEQKRLGMDLHDGLASSFASIKNQFDVLLMEVGNDKLKEDLQKIRVQVEGAYSEVRNKSHALFEEGTATSDHQFERRINSFVNAALSDKHFEKDILIDKGCVELLSIDHKIELIKIIQEAVANIIKHAEASKVSILLYEDESMMHLAISDNGKGYNTEQIVLHKVGLGLSSIRNRAEKIGGEVRFHSDESGTEISIKIPLKNLQNPASTV